MTLSLENLENSIFFFDSSSLCLYLQQFESGIIIVNFVQIELFFIYFYELILIFTSYNTRQRIMKRKFRTSFLSNN